MSEIVGREAELAVLRDFVDEEHAGPAALELEGEAGIGKSTLWLAGVEHARAGRVRVLSSRPAEAERGLAHVGLSDLFDGVLDEVLPALAPPRRRALEGALLLEEPAGTGWIPGRSGRRFAARCSCSPRTSGSSSRSTTSSGSTTRRRARSRSLCEGSARPTCSCCSPGASRRVRARRRSSRRSARRASFGCRSGPLSVGALHRFLRDRLGRPFARQTLLRIHERSGGNPFFALELARVLDADVDPLQPLPVPETLEELVRARISGLPASTREALALASAIGTTSQALLERAGVPADALEPAVAVARDRARERDDPLHPPPALVGPLPGPRREAADRPRTHRERRRRPASPRPSPRALEGHARRRDRASARRRRDAGGRSRRVRVAAELAEQALRLTPPDRRDERRRRALAAARAHRAAGEWTHARAIATGLLRRPGDRRAARGGPHPPRRAREHGSRGGPARGSTARGSLAAGAPVGDPLPARVGDALQERVCTGARARRCGSRARRGARRRRAPGARPRRAVRPRLVRRRRARAGCPGRRTTSPPPSAATSSCRRRRWPSRTPSRRPPGGRRRARLFEREHREWQQRDEPRSARALWGLAWVELWAGRWELAADYAARAHDISIQYGLEVPQDHLPIAVDRRPSRSARARPRALGTGTRAGSRSSSGSTRPSTWRSWGLSRSGAETPPAAEWLDKADRQAAALGWGEPSVRWWSADYVELLLELGRVDDAVRVLDAWEADAARVGREWVLAHVTRCRGLVAAAEGSVEQAASLLQQAVAQHEEVGDPFGRARALLALGIVRRRARQKRAAREAIQAALDGFEQLGAADLGREGARRAREHRRAQARGGAHGGRAPRRLPGRRGADEPGGRSRAVPRRADGGQPPDARLRQARRPLAHRARAQSSDVLTFPRRGAGVLASSACRATSSRPTSLAAKRESARPASDGHARPPRS